MYGSKKSKDKGSMKVSVVIPTCNRPESLRRVLHSLSGQDYPLEEVIIVDASEPAPNSATLRRDFPNLNILYQTSEPSVCVQRNKGIRLASSPWIFLCDDDMEYPPDYVSALMTYLKQHPEVGAISGVVMEAGQEGQPVFQFPAISFKQLLWNFIFQLTVWADLDSVQPNFMNRFPLWLIKKFYAARGNTYTLAGWPLISSFSSPMFKTTIYGLGASIIRRDWLIESPYDEILDRHGIGDNYGVAIHFPGEQPIAVLTTTCTLHHKTAQNRLNYPLVYFRRLLALHYFMKKSRRFSILNRGFLLWSLFGNWLSQTIRREKTLAQATGKAMKLIVLGKNPYLLAWKRKEGRIVEPELGNDEEME